MSEIEQVSFCPAPSSGKVQVESLAEKLVPDTWTGLPAKPDCELRVINGVLLVVKEVEELVDDVVVDEIVSRVNLARDG